MPRKVFVAGEVLTASDVNTNLMDQAVMTFAGTAARGSAIASPVEGMVSYLADTNRLEIYGGTAIGWAAASDYAFGTATTGDSLVYDGTKWVNGPRSQNAIINSDFGIWQRGTSASFNNQYLADRWAQGFATAIQTGTISRQTFSAGELSVPSYGSPEFFIRLNCTNNNGSTLSLLEQAIEDVRKFAGQTATFSFYAKASSSVTFQTQIFQIFGSGGSGSVTVSTESFSLDTAWQRYSITFSVPSISGKTIGANSHLLTRFIMPLSAYTIDIWGVQLEAGPVATPFQLAGGGSRATELALCQRYYYRTEAGGSRRIAVGHTRTTTQASLFINFPVTMRTNPTALEQSGTAAHYSILFANTGATCSAVPTFVSGQRNASTVTFTVAAGLTAGQGCLGSSENADGYLAWSAEL